VYNNITVVGIGTLGGFVADAISELEKVSKLTIIDHDLVEEKNLINSIYRQIDVGLPKVDALSDIITLKYPDIKIEKIQEKFIEGRTKIPKTDLILDCRDYTYDRLGLVDARLYMSSRYLIVDCRRYVTYLDKQEGKYLVQLSREDLKYASFIVSLLVNSNTIEIMKKSEIVQKYELDHFKKINKKNTYDIVYENGEKFINLPESIKPIIDLNKSKELTVFIGSKMIPITQTIIPVRTLQNELDVISNLSSIVKIQDFNAFIISIQNSSEAFIELIPETGAA
jgi:hypothetical protein